MSSEVSSDKRFLSWNIFMLHLLFDHEFDHLNNNPTIAYSSWAEIYSDKVCASFDQMIKQAEKQRKEKTNQSQEIGEKSSNDPTRPPPTLIIPETELPMSLSPNEVYQGLLQFAPPYGPDPSSPQIEYSKNLEFTSEDDDWIDFSSDHGSRSATLSSALTQSPPSVSPSSLSSISNNSLPRTPPPPPSAPIQPICRENLPASLNAPDQLSQPFSKVISRPLAQLPPVRRPSSGFASDFNSSDDSPVSGNSNNNSAALPPPHLYRPHRRRRPRSAAMCNFCRNNGEAASIYTAHNTKDQYGYVSCPILFSHICEACGATGMHAHTRSYCPLARVMRDVFNDDSNMQMRYSNFAKTARDK